MDFVCGFTVTLESIWTPSRLLEVLTNWKTQREVQSVLRKFHSDEGFRRRQHLLEEIMLQYSYPRLDINVTKGVNHLLKSPFCVHPKTGKICVPFSPRSVDKFNPENVPTITQVIQEINDYDADRKKHLTQEELSKSRVKDYRKTSLNKSIVVFEEFVRKLEDSCKDGSLSCCKMDISLDF